MDSRSRQRIANYKNNARNADDMRKERVKKFAEDRKMKRAEAGLLRRNLEVSPIEAPKPISIKSKLEKWKADKVEKERLAKLKARPPFVTGKVTHKVGSAFFYQVEPLPTSQRMTRSATKKNKDKSEGVGKNTIPKNFKFKAPANIVPIPLSYSSTKARINTGKDKDGKSTKATSACNNSEDTDNKEVQSSTNENGSSLTNMTEVVERTINSLNIADENVLERDVKSFRVELDTEIASLQALCEQWTELKDVNLPEHVNDLIDLAVGQTKLLISKKLVQYRGLIDDCEADPNRVTCSDLQGFWDMVYMQVKDVNSKFEKLQSLRDNNWTEEVIKQKTVVKKKVVPKKQNNNTKTAKSSIRSFIEAARNKSTKTVSTTPGRSTDPPTHSPASLITTRTPGKRSSPQNRKSGGIKATFTPKSQSGKENKYKPKTPIEIRRMSQALMKISSQAKEFGTPKSQKRNEASPVEVGDIRNTRSVKFAGQEVQLNGATPVPKVKVPSTPFVQHNLIDLDNTSEASLNVLKESDSNVLATPKRPHSLRRSRRLQKS